VLKSDAFINSKVDFFSGQTANKDVYNPAENSYKGFDYSPFTTYFYAQLTAELVKVLAGKETGSQAASVLQNTMVQYAKSQGFTVK
jgi:multiple sugar transport system substrate-binding protein